MSTSTSTAYLTTTAKTTTTIHKRRARPLARPRRRSILRSRDGVRTVALSLDPRSDRRRAGRDLPASGSVALLADLIHNVGDALTAVPLGIAFLLRTTRGEKLAGLFVVPAIFVSACVAGYEAIHDCSTRAAPDHLGALAAAGAIGFIGNWLAAHPTRAGHRLRSPALIADGDHARADGYVTLGVIASALRRDRPPRADPLIGLAITLVILRITWECWRVSARVSSARIPRHASREDRRSAVEPLVRRFALLSTLIWSIRREGCWGALTRCEP